MTGLCCALTGHREIPANFNRNDLYDALEQLILEGFTTFYCGMARGFDLIALACLIDLKQRYRVRLEACIPYAGQANGFPFSERKMYEFLLTWCDEKTVLSENYFKGCMLARNRYMVDRCDLLFAYCTKNEGGTAYTVRYARERGVEVRMLNA